MNPCDVNVLLISSANPLIGPGRIGLDYYKAYNEYGFKTDFLTLYPVEGYEDIFYVKEKKDPSFLSKIGRYINKKYKKFFFRQQSGFYFFYKYEKNPPVSNSVLLKSIKKKYDIVVILFWQEMLSFSSIKAIYDKIQCNFHFLGVDYSQMSGGCHFVGDCKGYIDGCKECLAVKPLLFNNFAKENVQFRKAVYEKIKPIVGGNTYMIDEFYKKSYLLKDVQFAKTDAIINLDKFKPYNHIMIREKLKLPKDKTFYILFGAQNLSDKRKGIIYLLEALSIFSKKISEIEKTKICVITIGKTVPEIINAIPFEHIDYGYVSEDILIEIYAASDVFLSSTINDAGPIMINQSQSCGTPVVAFEIGGALDCIKNKNTGYCAKLLDSEDFANGIQYIYQMTNVERNELRARNRDYALAHYSFKAAGERLKKIYEDYWC